MAQFRPQGCRGPQCVAGPGSARRPRNRRYRRGGLPPTGPVWREVPALRSDRLVPFPNDASESPITDTRPHSRDRRRGNRSGRLRAVTLVELSGRADGLRQKLYMAQFLQEHVEWSSCPPVPRYAGESVLPREPRRDARLPARELRLAAAELVSLTSTSSGVNSLVAMNKSRSSLRKSGALDVRKPEDACSIGCRYRLGVSARFHVGARVPGTRFPCGWARVSAS